MFGDALALDWHWKEIARGWHKVDSPKRYKRL